ncbi:MAG: hypothetical protein ABDI07_05160 [Candidatus Kryptonium sp.]
MCEIRTVKKAILILLIFSVIFSNLSFSQTVMQENVKFLLDCWKYHFGWKTFGGGYIRHILLFTDSHIVDIETNRISRQPGYSSGAPGTKTDGYKILYEVIFFGIIEFTLAEILKGVLESLEEKMNEEVKKTIKLASENPTVENFIHALNQIGLKSQIKETYSYAEIENPKVERKKDEIHFNFKFRNKKQNYILRYDTPDKLDKIEMVLKKLLGYPEKEDTNSVNYLSIYNSDDEENVTKFGSEEKYAKSSHFIELLGQGITISGNYDYRFRQNLTFRIGLGFLPAPFFIIPLIPATINFLTGTETSHHLELGVGATFFFIYYPSATFLYLSLSNRKHRI